VTRDGNGPAFQAGDAGSTPVAPSRGSPTLSCAGDIWPGITSPQARRSPSRGITGSQGEHIAPLAQLAEQATLNRRVGGSRPSRRTWARGAMLAGSSRAGSRMAYAADSNPVTPEGSSPSSPTRMTRPSCESLSGPSLGRNKAVTPGGVKTPGDNGVWGNRQPGRFWPCQSWFESRYSSWPQGRIVPAPARGRPYAITATCGAGTPAPVAQQEEHRPRSSEVPRSNRGRGSQVRVAE
jgi:hypothetical protein